MRPVFYPLCALSGSAGAAAVAVLLAADERSIHVALWSAAAASAVSVVVSASRLRKIAHPAETG